MLTNFDNIIDINILDFRNVCVRVRVRVRLRVRVRVCVYCICTHARTHTGIHSLMHTYFCAGVIID